MEDPCATRWYLGISLMLPGCFPVISIEHWWATAFRSSCCLSFLSLPFSHSFLSVLLNSDDGLLWKQGMRTHQLSRSWHFRAAFQLFLLRHWLCSHLKRTASMGRLSLLSSNHSSAFWVNLIWFQVQIEKLHSLAKAFRIFSSSLVCFAAVLILNYFPG